MKIKSILMSGALLLTTPSMIQAQGADVMLTERGSQLIEIFRQNKDQLLDWAIASSIEGAFYYGNGGRKGFGGQVPIIFLDRGIVSGDLGYVSITEASPNDLKVGNLNQASLAPGVSIRVNRILEVYFPKAADNVRFFNGTTEELWDRFFFGPAYSYVTETSEHIGWFKCGFKIF